MTIDDRLRGYADRWNAASPPPSVRVGSCDEEPLSVVTAAAPHSRRRRAPALIAAVLVAAAVTGAITAVVVVARQGAPTAVAPATTYPPGTVDTATPPGELIPVGERRAATDVTGPLLSGGTWSSAAEAGQVVVIAAWGSWCAPCVGSAGALDGLVRPGVSVAGFAVHDVDASLRPFVAAQDIRYPVVVDPAADVVVDLAPTMAAVGFPMTFLIDRDGGIAAVYVGVCPIDDLERAVTALLG